MGGGYKEPPPFIAGLMRINLYCTPQLFDANNLESRKEEY